MKKYKICVYTICKNEEKFVERWYNSIKDADGIFVLDTGSTDNTVNKLRQLGVNVICKSIIPWRFDTARNECLNLIPDDYDICISLDMDEVLNKNWKKTLNRIWKKDTNRLRYLYNWSLDGNNNPLVSFYTDKIHGRKGYTWENPVHEVLKYKDNNENYIISNEIIINHYPDQSKSRSSYLPLLEMAIKENPTNDRNMHYLGREYMYYGKWNESIDTLIKHLNLPTATWKDERSASMRFISRCYYKLNRYNEAIMWLKLAINEAPYLRDPYVEMALLEYNLSRWNNVITYCNKALEINYHEKTYINETFSWDSTIYDLLSIAYFNINEYKNALKNINIAISMDSSNKRLINNKIIMENKIREINQ